MSVTYGANKHLDTTNLPAVPRVLVELLRLCHDDEADFEGFAGLIEQEPGLTTKILQVANSSAYRQWNEVGDLRRMLIVLGLGSVRTIVATAAVEQFFSGLSDKGHHQVQRIWLRSILTANCCERLARLLGYNSPGEAFLTGLLHQIGMLILLKNNEATYLPLLEKGPEHITDFCQKERDLFQTDYCELGAVLVESWELDSFLAAAIRHQQAPCTDLASAPTLLKILAVAARSQHPGHHSVHADFAARLLGLTTDTLNRCNEEAFNKSAQMLTALGLDNALARVQRFQENSSIDPDPEAAARLREAVRYLALSRATAADFSADLILFARQIRLGFTSVFPVKQLLLLTCHDPAGELFPINDLNRNQLRELVWSTDDATSQVVQAFSSGSERLLTRSNGAIIDRQLLRVLASDQAHLIPLRTGQQSLGLLVLSLDEQTLPASHQTLTLIKLLCADIAKSFATLKNALNRTHMSPKAFRTLVHEVSNPLSVIANYLYILGKKLDAGHEAQGDLTIIREEIDRVGRILIHAKDPQATQHDSSGPLDINKLITELDRLFSGSLYSSSQIQSVLHLDPHIPDIICSADKLKQILINLCKNAAEAVQTGGTIEIITRDGIFQNLQRFIEITIKDDGPGIDPAVLPRLFQPVTSTKPGHSGLGLTVAQTLSKELGGSLSCSSAPERGTAFTLLLPRITDLQQE